MHPLIDALWYMYYMVTWYVPQHIVISTTPCSYAYTCVPCYAIPYYV